MKKALKTLTLASVMALAAQSAFATERNNERPERPTHGTQAPQTQHQTANGGRGGDGGNGTGIGVGTGTGIATATGTGVGTGIATSGSTSGATAQTGPITNTNGASASTGPVTNTNLNGATASTGPVSVETGPVSNTNTTGPSTATTGPVSVAPSQSTVNTFRSFVGTNAPNLSGAVDNCLAVLGWSAAVNVFGNTGVGLGGGNQRTEYVEQCAAVKSAFEVWNRANGDINKETFAIDLLIKALPTYGKPAMDSAVNRINTYIEQNGDQEPDSVINIFGAKSFKKKPVAPVEQPPAAPQPSPVTVVVNPVVHTKETVRTVTAQPKKAAPPKPACDCKQ